ncbi:MAG: polysaccharide biosynthesis/export family protein [Spirosomataceae bacterium]
MRFFLFYVLFCPAIWAQNNLSDTTKTGVASPLVASLDTVIYRIKVGDRLRIRSLNALEIIYPASSNLSVGVAQMSSGQAGNAPAYLITVDRTGQIVLPQVGRIKVVGLSKMEVTHLIEKSYQNLINEPVFEVEITNLSVRVLGAVARQGTIALDNEKLTLGEVIALSGGVDFATADRTIKLIRKGSGREEEINYDIRNLSNPAVANIPVFDGDYVFIPPSKGSIRNIKNQRIASILSPIAIGLNALAVVLGLYLAIR